MINIFKNVFLGLTIFILFPFIKLECPTGLPVTNSSECYKWETNLKQCCLLTSKNRDSICYPFNVTDPIPPTQIYGYIEYKVDCFKNISTSNLSPSPVITLIESTNIIIPSLEFPNQSNLYGLGFSNCGKQNPQSLKDCSIDSTSTQSCCYYSYMEKNGCFWVSYKANESNISKTQKNAFPLTCASEYKKHIHILLFLLAFILI
jgi:hypothetical protein